MQFIKTNTIPSIIKRGLKPNAKGKITLTDSGKKLCDCELTSSVVVNKITGLLDIVNTPRDLLKAILCKESELTREEYYDLKMQDFNVKTTTGEAANQLMNKYKDTQCPACKEDGAILQPDTKLGEENKQVSPKMCPACDHILEDLSNKILKRFSYNTATDRDRQIILDHLNNHIRNHRDYIQCYTRNCIEPKMVCEQCKEYIDETGKAIHPDIIHQKGLTYTSFHECYEAECLIYEIPWIDDEVLDKIKGCELTEDFLVWFKQNKTECEVCQDTLEIFGEDSDEYRNCMEVNCNTEEIIRKDWAKVQQLLDKTQKIKNKFYGEIIDEDPCLLEDLSQTLTKAQIYGDLPEQSVVDLPLPSCDTMQCICSGKSILIDNIPYIEDTFLIGETKVKRLSRVFTDEDLIKYFKLDISGMSAEDYSELIDLKRKSISDVKYSVNDRETFSTGIIAACEYKEMMLDQLDINVEEKGNCTYLTYTNKITKESVTYKVCNPRVPEDFDYWQDLEDSICEEAVDIIIQNDKELMDNILKRGVVSVIDINDSILRDYIKYNVIYLNKEFRAVVNYLCKEGLFNLPTLRQMLGKEPSDFLKNDGKILEGSSPLVKPTEVVREYFTPNEEQPLVVSIRSDETYQEVLKIENFDSDILIPRTLIPANVLIDSMSKIKSHLEYLESQHGFRSSDYLKSLKIDIKLPSKDVPLKETIFVPEPKNILATFIPDKVMREYLLNSEVPLSIQISTYDSSYAKNGSQVLVLDIDINSLADFEKTLTNSTEAVKIQFQEFKNSLIRLSDMKFYEIPVEVFSYIKMQDDKEKLVIEF